MPMIPKQAFNVVVFASSILSDEAHYVAIFHDKTKVAYSLFFAP